MTIQTAVNKSNILTIAFDLIGYKEAFERIEHWRQIGERQYVALTNPHSVMLCRRNENMAHATRNAGMILPDGIGVIVAANLLGYANHGRATGPTLMLKVCDWGRNKGYRHYFMGGAAGVAEKLAKQLTEKYPGLSVAGTYCPPFRKLSDAEDQAIVDRINAAEADIVWVGLGAPKQEKWMADHVGRIDAAAMVGVGAAFDFHSGDVKWSPPWIRRLGMEWAYRLAIEPRRMWRRNLDSPLFLGGVVIQRITNIFRRDRSHWRPSKPR
ncbi:MAG: WecB/TagA/CpsF family glycosyltransferase [Planctomycetota bacterium]